MKNVCPQIRYRKAENGLVITACYGNDGHIVLPDEIDGQPVVAIAPYTFSDCELSETDLIYISRETEMFEDIKRLKTTEVLSVRLPAGIKEVGRYAFYRCRNLKKLELFDGIREIGGGALTGCRGIREVEIHFRDGEKSALKSILDEVRFSIHCTLHYNENMVEILFPEHYEEAVENTPARNLSTAHHGSGGDYRQCFYNWELDYKKYDELLPRAMAEETVDIVAAMAFLRLRYPYKLTDVARNGYLTYIEQNQREIIRFLVKKEESDNLKFMLAGEVLEETLVAGIESAQEFGKTEILSTLMDEKYRRYPKKKKTFDW